MDLLQHRKVMEKLRQVDAQTLKDWLDEGNVCLIDVREPIEYQEESIPGAQLVALSQFDLHAIQLESGKKLVFYCRSGGRSTEACLRWLKADDSQDVYNLIGGILSWKKHQFPIKS